MDELKIMARTREERGSAASRRLRRAGEVPGILATQGQEPVPLAVGAHEFDKVLRSGAQLVTMHLDKEELEVLVREIQWDTFGEKLLHIDFDRVVRGEKLQVEIPLAVGRVIAGRVLFPDGAPAAGARFSVSAAYPEPVARSWRASSPERMPPIGGTAEFSQFTGLWTRTVFVTSVVFSGSPLHTTILPESINRSPSSSSILRLINVGSERSVRSQVFPGAFTPRTLATNSTFLSEPFPPVPTF